jgi:NADH-quinone oxidoreductase subunit J
LNFRLRFVLHHSGFFRHSSFDIRHLRVTPILTATMLNPQQIIAAGAFIGAIGLWLMLPRGTAPGRMLGVLLGLVSLGLFGSLLWPLGGRGANVVFWVIAGVTLISAAATITFRNPVHCAVWFALSLLGTAGLFLIQGAQFLAVATIVVYAGAILVTFLFVLMLAQSGGRAFYDRITWEPLLASATGAVLVGVLTTAIVGASLQEAPVTPSKTLAKNVLADDHVAHLGAELFSHYLVAVEIGGTLLLVALVGAIAMVELARGGAGGRRSEVGGRRSEVGDGDSRLRFSNEPSASAGRTKEPTHG